MPNEINPTYGGYQPITRYGHDTTSSGAFGGKEQNLSFPTAQASGSAALMDLPKYSGSRESSPAQTSESASPPPAYTPMAPYAPMVPGRSSRNFFANMDAPCL